MIKLNWISNEKEKGKFLQIRNLDDKQYFITKHINDLNYILTVIDDRIKMSFESIEIAQNWAEMHYTMYYLNN